MQTIDRIENTRTALKVGFGDSVAGRFVVAVSEAKIVAIVLGDDRASLERDVQRRFRGAALTEDPALAALVGRVAAFIADPARAADLPLEPSGTEFQRRVWQALRQVPAGTTASYAEIAAKVGAPAAVRAVAQACAANPIAVAIPCHRVRRKDGALGGYRWGVERKAMLLRAEGAL